VTGSGPLPHRNAHQRPSRGHEKVLHEERLEFVEWSILIFLVAGVILDCVIVYQGFHK
jgi:hypothetical protein